MGRVKDTGFVNPQDVYNYLVVNKGLSREHALGMLANIQGESGFKIAVQEYGKATGTGGVGLYQHTGSRRNALMKYTGGNISDWTKQVDFALQEADTKKYLAQTFQSPEEASIWFTTKWERPANAQQRAQERLKYLNNYSTFSGYESEYVPAANTNTNTKQGDQTSGIPPQTVIPFEVVVAGQPVQASFSYEEFEKALTTVKKTEEKTEQSAARQELEQQTSTQEEFLKAISSLSMPPESESSSQGRSQQQDLALGTGPYTPIEIPELQGQLPQMPNLFSTQLPQMKAGGEPIKTIDGVQYVQDAQGNWKYASGAPVTDRALAQRLQYEPERPATQGSPKSTPATIKAQQTARQINSPVIAEQRQATADKIAADQLREDIRAEAQDRWKTLPQSAGSADWVFAAPMVAPMALEALGVFGSSALGQAANIGFGVHGISQIPQRVESWQDVVAGNKDWKEAATESLMTGLELYAGYGAAKTLLPQTYKINPLAGRLGQFNRVVGEDAIADLQNSGLVRSGSSGGVDTGLARRTTAYPSFGKGLPKQAYIDQTIRQGKVPYIISTDRPMAVSTLGRHGKGTTMFPTDESGNYVTAFSANDVKVFGAKPHWLKGYEEIIQQPPAQRPDLSYLGISPEQQELLNLQQVNNTTMLSSVAPPIKLDIARASYKSQEGLPPYMNPSMYPTEQIMSRFTPEYQQYIRTRELQKAADRVIQRTTDDKVYYDVEGNIIKTPADNLKNGGRVSAKDTKEMVDGIAQILAQVNNTKNRSEIARNMIYDFEREGLSYDLGKFLRNAGVK